MTTPDDLRRRAFPVVARGYDRIAVTEFLDDLADELDVLLASLEGAASSRLERPDHAPDWRDPFATFTPRTAEPLPPPPAPPPSAAGGVGAPTGDAVDVDNPGFENPDFDNPDFDKPDFDNPDLESIDTERLGLRIGQMVRRAQADADELRGRGQRALDEARERAAALLARAEAEARAQIAGEVDRARESLDEIRAAERDARRRLDALAREIDSILRDDEARRPERHNPLHDGPLGARTPPPSGRAEAPTPEGS